MVLIKAPLRHRTLSPALATSLLGALNHMGFALIVLLTAGQLPKGFLRGLGLELLQTLDM